MHGAPNKIVYSRQRVKEKCIIYKSVYWNGTGEVLINNICIIFLLTMFSSTRNRLDAIQHEAVRIECGAFCSTAASALQVESINLEVTSGFTV